jgi:uncharacterized membrane protein (DUF485 family)
MGGFDHGPADPALHDNEQTSARNARYGMVLFVLYLVLYGGFVLLNAFYPAVMDQIPFGGVNLAITYGFGLIVAALLLALVYAWLCRLNMPDAPARKERS